MEPRRLEAVGSAVEYPVKDSMRLPRRVDSPPVPDGNLPYVE